MRNLSPDSVNFKGVTPMAIPEYIVGAGIAALLSLFGVAFRRLDTQDRRMDNLELKVAEQYVTKEEFNQRFTELFTVLHRMEDKIDYNADMAAKIVGKRGL
tara:strand:+ start:150 stop:452 length:303 start_codon:yes stop_codon:yes gene_type:complete